MAVQTFRHAEKLSPSGHRLPDRFFAMRALLRKAVLEEPDHALRMSEKSISLDDRFRSLTAIRQRDPACQAISLPMIRSALIRPDRAMQAFHTRIRTGREPVLAHLRARSRYRPLSVDDPKPAPECGPDPGPGPPGARCAGRALPRMRLAIRRSLPPLDRLRGLPVVRRARRVEVQFLFEPDLPAVRTVEPERPPGQDANARSRVNLSDGGHLKRPQRPVVRSAIRRKQCALSCSRRGWKSRGKKRAMFAPARERAVESGRRELHRLGKRNVKSCGFISVEALQVRNMPSRRRNKRGFNRAIAEQGWKELFYILECRAASAGIPLVEVPPADASARASEPGFRRRPRSVSTIAAGAGLNWTATRPRPGTCRAVARAVAQRPWQRLDGALRSGTFRSPLIEQAEDLPYRAGAMRKAAPGNRAAVLQPARIELAYCKTIGSKFGKRDIRGPFSHDLGPAAGRWESCSRNANFVIIKPEAEAGSREAGSRKPEAGSRKPEAGSRKPEAGSRKPEAGSRKPEAGSRKPEAGSRKPEAGSRKPEAGSPRCAIAQERHAPADRVEALPTV